MNTLGQVVAGAWAAIMILAMISIWVDLGPGPVLGLVGIGGLLFMWLEKLRKAGKQ